MSLKMHFINYIIYFLYDWNKIYSWYIYFKNVSYLFTQKKVLWWYCHTKFIVVIWGVKNIGGSASLATYVCYTVSVVEKLTCDKDSQHCVTRDLYMSHLIKLF